MPNIAFQHKDYKRMKPEWDLINACLEGAPTIKAAKTLYLPMPNATDTSAENKARYDIYIDRAMFFEATSRTLDGLVGEVFAKPSTYDLPKELEMYEENIDGAGTTLDQQSKQALRYVLSLGRCGLLADFPKKDVKPDASEAEKVTTVADLQNGNVRPKLLLYGPCDIINWALSTFGARTIPGLIVLEETTDEAEDGFEVKEKKQYRVLRLSTKQEYFVEIWAREKDNAEFKMTDSTIPAKSDGNPFDYIPFQFIGATDNTAKVGPAPMSGLARLNIAHYKNSADYEYSVYSIGMPTGVCNGLTQQWVDANFPNKKLPLGSNVALLLPVGGDFNFRAPGPNTMAKEAMEHKEKLMVALGAKLVEQRDVQRTATEAGLDSASKTSVLGTAAQNVSFAYTASLYDAAQFLNVGVKEVPFDLNTDFDISKMDPQTRAQLLAEWQANGITTSEYRAKMREGGVATLDDEEYKEELEEDALANPLMDPLNPLNTDPLTGLPKVVKDDLSPEEQEEMKKRAEQTKKPAAAGKK